MTDLTRLMFDDGATRVVDKPHAKDGPYAVFTWKGVNWAAYVVTDPNFVGRCWHLRRNDTGNLSWDDFDRDPAAFVSHHMANGYQNTTSGPGWVQGVESHLNRPDRIVLLFERLS